MIIPKGNSERMTFQVEVHIFDNGLDLYRELGEDKDDFFENAFCEFIPVDGFKLQRVTLLARNSENEKEAKKK